MSLSFSLPDPLASMRSSRGIKTCSSSMILSSRSGRGDPLTTDDRDRSGEDDTVVKAIGDLSQSIEENVSDEEDLLSELDRIRDEGIAGVPLRQAIGEAGQPRALVLLNRVVNRLILGSSRLRRALVTSVAHEGTT